MRKNIKVRATTEPKKLAGSIMHSIDAETEPVVQAIGANAINSAMKGIAVAVKVFNEKDRELVVRPYFTTDTSNNKEVTVMNLEVKELVQ